MASTPVGHPTPEVIAVEPVQLAAVLAAVVVLASVLSVELRLFVTDLGTALAVDGSQGSEKALDCSVSLCAAPGARLTGLDVEGRLPVYAATAGEVEEVKRAHGHDLIVIGHRGHFPGTTCSARPRTASRTTPTVPSWSSGRTAFMHFELHASRRLRSILGPRRAQRRRDH
jgi:hypothetical protein